MSEMLAAPLDEDEVAEEEARSEARAAFDEVARELREWADFIEGMGAGDPVRAERIRGLADRFTIVGEEPDA